MDLSNCSALVGSSPIRSMRSFTNLQSLNLKGCWKINGLAGLSELISLDKLTVSCTSISELPDLRKLEQLEFLDVSSCQKLTSLIVIAHAIALRHVDASRCKKLRELPDLRKLEQLEFLDVSSCQKLTSLIVIAHATALRHVEAWSCENLRELPDDFSRLKKLEMLDLCDDGLICTLPNDYERLAGCGILKVKGCLGLVVPLVKELQRQIPERSHVNCVKSTGCISRCEQSIQSWIDVRKDLSRAAYDLLINVFSSYRCLKWSYLLDDEEIDGFLVRALGEHDDRGTFSLQSITKFSDDSASYLVVVATAPCTFGIMTERAMLEPWDKTLLHYTMVKILPRFLVCEDLPRMWNGSNQFDMGQAGGD